MSSTTTTTKVNRPQDTAFQQQRLKAWQPILTPRWVIGTFTCIACIFIPVGIALYIQAAQVFEQVIVYDSDALANANCRIKTQNEGYDNIVNGTRMDCTVTFSLTQDISAPLNLYYQLTNFYQNHRRYVKSRNDAQLGGANVDATTLQTSCDPEASFQTTVTNSSAPNGTAPLNLIYYPCGLIATSYFNDRFDLTNGPAGSYVDETKIAWSVDMKYKFSNPTGQAVNKWNKYLYMWQAYDQMSCYDTNGVRGTCLKWKDLVPGAFGTGCAKCPTGYSPRSEGGIPPPGGWQDFDPYSTTGNATASYGLRDEHFVVWMRTAGLPTFRKLYGVVQPASGTTFKRGDTLTFSIVPNFEVGSFQGTKSLVLSTATPIGGRSDVMAVAYLVVGSLCLALAIAFLVKHMVAPRKLGDTSNIQWRQGPKTA